MNHLKFSKFFDENKQILTFTEDNQALQDSVAKKFFDELSKEMALNTCWNRAGAGSRMRYIGKLVIERYKNAGEDWISISAPCMKALVPASPSMYGFNILTIMINGFSRRISIYTSDWAIEDHCISSIQSLDWLLLRVRVYVKRFSFSTPTHQRQIGIAGSLQNN